MSKRHTSFTQDSDGRLVRGMRGRGMRGSLATRGKRTGCPKSPSLQNTVAFAVAEAMAILADWPLANARLQVVLAAYRHLCLLQGVVILGGEGAPGAFAEAIGRIAVPAEATPPEVLGWVVESSASAHDQRRRGAHFTPRSMAADVVWRTLKPLYSLVPSERSLELRVCDPAVGGGVFLVEVVSQIANRLVASGAFDDLAQAKRLAAIHCVYGVDKDPVSVVGARLAVTLECRGYAMPSDWLDDNIKHGDALVGLDNVQISAFHWSQSAQSSIGVGSSIVDRAMATGVALRKERMRELSEIAMVEA